MTVEEKLLEYCKKHKHAIMSLIALCIMCGVYTGVVFNTLTLYMEPIINEIATISRTQFAMIITLAGGTNAVLSLSVFGGMVEKLKLKKCIILGAISICLALLLFAKTTGVMQLYIGGILLGIGITFGAAGAASVGVDAWFARHNATMLSIPIACGFAAGFVFSPMIGKWIVHIGWRNSFYTALIITVICSMIVAVLYKDFPEQVGESKMFSEEENATEQVEEMVYGVTFGEMFKTPQFYALSIGYFIAGITIYSVMSNMAIFSADYGFDAITQGKMLAVMFAASAIAMIPMGFVSDKFGTFITMLGCFGCHIIAVFILLGNTITDTKLYIAAVLVGISYIGTNGPATISVREGLGTRDFSKKMPIILGCMFAGVSFGNPALQMFYDIFGSYRHGFRIYLVLSVIAIGLIYVGTRKVHTEKRR